MINVTEARKGITIEAHPVTLSAAKSLPAGRVGGPRGNVAERARAYGCSRVRTAPANQNEERSRA